MHSMPLTAPMPGYDAMMEEREATPGGRARTTLVRGRHGHALRIAAVGLVVGVSAVMSVLNRQYTLDDALIY